MCWEINQLYGISSIKIPQIINNWAEKIIGQFKL